MAFNRYTQQSVYSQYNPLSLQELSMVPLAKQQKHDAQLAMALQQKAAAQALLKDQAEADRLIGEVDQRINNYTQELMTTGVSNNSLKNLLDLKNYRDNLMSSKGDLGKINANFVAYQQYATDLKKQYEKGDIDRDTYQRALAHSMNQYGGYKSGTFSGFTPSSRAKVDEIAMDYLKNLKLSKNSVEGWRWVDNYQGSGKGVWEKNGVTTTSARPPAEVEAAIMARVMASDQVRQNISDDLTFMEGLNEYRPDENGVFTIDGVAYSAEDFYSDADLRRDYGLQTMNNRIRSQIAPAVYASQTGQGSERTQDIKIPSGSGKDKNGRMGDGWATGDVGGTPQYFNTPDGIRGVQQKIKELENSNDPQDKVRAQRYQAWVDRKQQEFDSSPEGQKLKAQKEAWVKSETENLRNKTGISNLPEFIIDNVAKGYSRLEDVMGETPKKVFKDGDNWVTAVEYRKNHNGKEPNHAQTHYQYSFGVVSSQQNEALENYTQRKNTNLNPANWVTTPGEAYYNKMDNILEEGEFAESRVFNVSAERLTELKGNQQMLQQVISPTAYYIPGESEEKTKEFLTGLTNSDIKSMKHISYGDYDTPSLEITYVPKGADESQTITLKPRQGNKVGNMPNSYEASLESLFGEAQGGREVINTLNFENNNFGRTDFTDYYPALASKYNDIKVELKTDKLTNSQLPVIYIDKEPMTWEDYYTIVKDAYPEGTKIIPEGRKPGDTYVAQSMAEANRLLSLMEEKARQ